MSTPEPPYTEHADPEGVQAAVLLSHVLEALDGAGASVCRSFVVPGLSVPWDECCPCSNYREGQAWVRISQVQATDAFPGGAGPHRCAPKQYAVDLAVGVLRCAHTIDDAGNAPSASTITDDAGKVSRDRAILRDAIIGPYFGDLEPGDAVLRTWSPLGPSGGCVGGEWTLATRVMAPRNPLA